jgi:hypothetical protein
VLRLNPIKSARGLLLPRLLGVQPNDLSLRGPATPPADTPRGHAPRMTAPQASGPMDTRQLSAQVDLTSTVLMRQFYEEEEGVACGEEQGGAGLRRSLPTGIVLLC